MTTATTDDSLAVSSWLANLRMECYKKNLENYDTVKVRLSSSEGRVIKNGQLSNCSSS